MTLPGDKAAKRKEMAMVSRQEEGTRKKEKQKKREEESLTTKQWNKLSAERRTVLLSVVTAYFQW